MKQKYFAFLLTFFALNSLAFAAKISENSLQLGQPGSSGNKQFIFDTADGAANKRFILNHSTKQLSLTSNDFKLGDAAASNKTFFFDRGANNPGFRWNESTSSLEFTNDGTVYRRVGSGSGGAGGINLLSDFNADFEGGLTSWTATGLAASPVTSPASNVGLGTTSAVINSSASSQTFDSATVPVQSGMHNAPCVASIWNKTSENTNLYHLQVINVTDTVTVADYPLPARADYDKESGYVGFTCDSSKTYKLRISSTGNSADLFIDQAFLGEQKTVQVGGAVDKGTSKTTETAGCGHQVTSTSFVSYAHDVDCPAPVTTGGLTAPRETAVTIGSLPPGKLKISVTGQFIRPASAGYSCHYRMHDGTSPSLEETVQYSNASGGSSVIGEGDSKVFTFVYPSGFTSAKTFDLQAKSSSGNLCELDIGGLGYTPSPFAISVEYFPSESAQGIRADAYGKRVEAKISGSDISLSTGNESSFIEMTNGSLSLANSGSLAAQIACASGTASTGTTCSVDESNGIAFNVEEEGDWKVCANLNHNNTANQLGIYFRVDETNNANSTTIQAGTVTQGGNHDSTPGASSFGFPARVCDTFPLSTGLKTFRLKYAQSVSSVSANSVLDSFVGVTDIGTVWTAEPVNVKRNIPIVFKGMVTSSSSNPVRIESISFGGASEPSLCNSTPCTIYRSSSSWVSTVSYAATGVYTLNINSGIFSSEPICTATTRVANACVEETDTGSTTSKIFRARTCNSAAATDTGMNVTCIGPN